LADRQANYGTPSKEARQVLFAVNGW